VDVRDALLPQTLDAIFLPIGLQYTVEGNRVIVSRPTGGARPEKTVTSVQIANNRRIPTDTIRSELQTKVGDPISLTTISRDIGVLYSLGFLMTFSSKRIATERVPPNAVNVVFVVDGGTH
jgi:outer membrane protein assembly factor BamA